ncbi:MAG: hypothetical protein QXL78_00635 [Methanocellales archaeon]
MNQSDPIEELYRKFTVEFGGPNIFSRKATREKYLKEAIKLGYSACESEIANLKRAISELEGKISSISKPAISPREYNLEIEAKYHKARAENLLDALIKTIREYEKVIADLQDEIVKLHGY